jgi:putative MATE family efflux protein
MEGENKMGTMPVRRLLIHMSWPVMLSMLVQALYNLVDSMFVSWINEDALLALSLAFPVQSCMIALAVGTGAGVNAMLARRLGEKQREAANSVAAHGYFVYFLYWLVFLIFGFLMARRFFTLFGAEAQVNDYGGTYLTIITCCSLGMFMQFASERVLQASGHPVGYMLIQGVGAVLNLFLDPLLIFTCRLGVAGAAIATVTGQTTGMLLGFFLVRRTGEVTVSFRGFRPRTDVLKDIFRVGVPAIVTQSLVTVMIFALNKLLYLFSSTLVLVLGIYSRLQNFVFMPVFGLNSGMIPVISYNYGAGSRNRITKTVELALLIAGSIMLAGMLLMQFCPAVFLSIFRPSAETLEAGIPALRIISVAFLFAGISVILSAAFQSLGAPGLSMLIALLRQLVIILPAAWMLARVNPALVWWAFPIADALAALLAVLLYHRLYQSRLRHLTPRQ